MGDRFRARFRAAVAAGAVLVATAAAHADMGPKCRCEVGSGKNFGRSALATAIGVFGVGALFVERRRRSRR